MEAQPNKERPMSENQLPNQGMNPELERAELTVKLESATKRAEEYLDLLQRVQADFQNYRKRVDQERTDMTKTAKAEIIAMILPVIDDFQRGIEAIPNGSRGLPWVQGMSMVERKLQSILDAAGVAVIDPQGEQFNPWEHEAVVHEPTTAYESGSVIDVLRLGYKMDGKIIRPAQVKVAAPSRQE